MESQVQRRQKYLASLNAEMLEKGISKKALAKHIGVNAGRISLWLNGSVRMSVDTLIDITEEIRSWDKESVQQQFEEPKIPYGEVKPSLGYMIKKSLAESGMTQKELAYRVGTSQSRISEYIRGAVIPSLGVAARICKELQIDAKSYIEACCML